MIVVRVNSPALACQHYRRPSWSPRSQRTRRLKLDGLFNDDTEGCCLVCTRFSCRNQLCLIWAQQHDLLLSSSMFNKSLSRLTKVSREVFNLSTFASFGHEGHFECLVILEEIQTFRKLVRRQIWISRTPVCFVSTMCSQEYKIPALDVLFMA